MKTCEVWHVMCRDVEVASFEVNYETEVISNYQIFDTSVPVALPFPTECNGKPSFSVFIDYVLEHLIPEDRENIDEILEYYGLDCYDPIAFIHCTHGVMAEDDEWVRFDDEKLTFAEVDVFERA